jgi:hypothetical protein
MKAKERSYEILDNLETAYQSLRRVPSNLKCIALDEGVPIFRMS